MFDASSRGVLRVTSGTIAPGMTLINFSSSGGVSLAGGITVINYTVPTGKTLYITDVGISTDTNVSVLVQLTSGGIVICEAFVANDAPWPYPGIETEHPVPGGQIMKLIFASSNQNGAYSIGGYIQ